MPTSFSLFKYFPLILLLCSCNLMSTSSERNVSGLKIQFRPDSTMVYHITNTIEVQGLNQDKPSTSETDTRISYQFKSLPNNSWDITSKYLSIKSNQNGQSKASERGEFSSDPAERVLFLLTKHPLTLRMDSTGHITIVNGYEELKADFMKMIAVNNAAEQDMAQQYLDSKVKKDLVEKNFSSIAVYFPDSVIHRGAHWKTPLTGDSSLNTNGETIYTLSELSDEQATILSKTNISINDAAPGPAGISTPIQFKGPANGKITVDAKTGVVSRMEQEATLTGSALNSNLKIAVRTMVEKEE